MKQIYKIQPNFLLINMESLNWNFIIMSMFMYILILLHQIRMYIILYFINNL